MKVFTFIAKATKSSDKSTMITTDGFTIINYIPGDKFFHLEDGEIYEIKITKKENND